MHYHGVFVSFQRRSRFFYCRGRSNHGENSLVITPLDDFPRKKPYIWGAELIYAVRCMHYHGVFVSFQRTSRFFYCRGRTNLGENSLVITPLDDFPRIKPYISGALLIYAVKCMHYHGIFVSFQRTSRFFYCRERSNHRENS